MLKNFKTYGLAVQFHRLCKRVKAPSYLRDQLFRASASIALNLAEGSGKPTEAEQKRFYSIALGSLRECQAILELLDNTDAQTLALADAIGGCLYRLCIAKAQRSQATA